ncbi:MAG: T9SS type A sorting domain-containing protein [candidate division Zixibacteria bacterium]|nr:T9SS type A sorting domain-containing protein [candidate division Zixibacteria bacterium]
MLKSRFFVIVNVVVFGLLVAGLSAQDNGSGLVFTGCPPYVEGNPCDSMFYQVVAVDIGTGKACPTAKYFIVSGPGEINQKTGLWVFHPANEDLPLYYREELEIAAYKGNDTTTSDENCRFEVRAYGRYPRFAGYCGAHMTVLPGDTMVVPLEATDADWCHDPEIVSVEISPEPAGFFEFSAFDWTLTFIPDLADEGQTFEVVTQAVSGGMNISCRVFFDVFVPEPIKLRISMSEYGQIEPGDTVRVNIVLDECPVELSRLNLLMDFNSELLAFAGAVPGAAFYSPDSGCGWQELIARASPTCSEYPRQSLSLSAATQGHYQDPDATCFLPDSLPAVLATLEFRVAATPLPGDQFADINFYWCRCEDNYLWGTTRDSSFTASAAYSPDGLLILPDSVPGYAGTSDDCFFYGRVSAERTRRVEYQSGGIHFTPLVGSAPYSVRLGIIEDQFQGQFTDLPITLEATDSDQGLSVFDFLIGYDASTLAFQQAFEGNLYDSCGWEYFTYRYGGYSECGTACPSGILRVFGFAETCVGSGHPGCDEPFPGYVQPDQLPITLANLRFLVSNDWNLEGQFVPIRFFWYDCIDNIVYNQNAGEIYLSARVFDENDSIISREAEFPTWFGARDECINSLLSAGRYARRYVDYHNGGIGIFGEDPIDARGDINMNGVPWEIADAVMFTNYFITGQIVFGIHVEGSIAASDCNGDGIGLSVADLVYMARVTIGDASPCDDTVPSANIARFSQDPNGVISVETPDSLGAVYLVVEGNVSVMLLADNMEMIYGLDSGWTRILVYSFEANQFLTAGPIIAIPNTSSIIEVSTATFTGCPVVSSFGGPADVDDDPYNLPTEFALGQNYPNPFNPTTMIEFDLPKSSAVRLEIYNITGQKVRTLVSGQLAVGRQSVEWDGRDTSGRRVSSGIYLYRLTAGEFVQTRKMLLLK